MGRKIVMAAGVAAALALAYSSPLIAQGQQTALTEKEVIQLIKESKRNLKDAVSVLEQRDVDFDLDAKVEKKLRKAGADDATIQDVWKAGPTSRANQKAILASATGAQIQVSPKEGIAFQTIQNEMDPSRRLQMVNEFERDFPNSPILSNVYAQGAKACQEKGDLNKAVEYGEKSLKVDPTNLPALLVVAVSVSQPSMVSRSDIEAKTRLAEAQGDADRVLKLLPSIPKQANETDEQFQKRKGEYAGDAYFALGMVALLGDKPAKAVEEFNNAINSSSNPTPQYYYRLGEAYASSQRPDEAIKSFTKAGELGKGTVMEQYAKNKVAELKKGKP